MTRYFHLLIFLFLIASCSTPKKYAGGITYREQHRPQFHFSPPQKWMNDPNGMVFHDGNYHLFYQYYPDSTVWGPMHWGHALSNDLVHWKHLPIALYPDSLGYIFSGSAVVDENNSSGFGIDGKAPLVAIYTYHDPKKEKRGAVDVQTQGIAYSNDGGFNWTKYQGNPVLLNPGIVDFRDPKVCWFEPAKKWIMTLATKDHITFYSSPNLKQWTKESEFGKEFGAHGGVWECPDLFTLDHQGQKIWVLIVNLNPGGPNGGSATQYFTGQFNGQQFIPYETATKWLDYGPDEYAGVTWSNTGNRKIFLGWMTNWQYAQLVPTQQWRSSLTVPRELGLEKINGSFFIKSKPVEELNRLGKDKISFENIDANNNDLTTKIGRLKGPAKIVLKAALLESFDLSFFNEGGETLQVGYDKTRNQYFADRRRSGKLNFEAGFAARHVAPRISGNTSMDITLFLDESSIELFADDGLTLMTQTFFPNSPYTGIKLSAEVDFKIGLLQFCYLKSIWNKR